MITLAKDDTLHSRWRAASFLETPQSVKKLFETFGPRFAQCKGGYTRLTRLGPRQGDGAEQCIIELVRRAEDRRRRREARQKAAQEGAQAEEPQE